MHNLLYLSKPDCLPILRNLFSVPEVELNIALIFSFSFFRKKPASITLSLYLKFSIFFGIIFKLPYLLYEISCEYPYK